MALRIDKVQLQFDIKPNYEAQQFNKLKEDLSQAKPHKTDAQTCVPLRPSTLLYSLSLPFPPFNKMKQKECFLK